MVNNLDLVLQTEADLRSLGQKIGENLSGGAVLILQGELGAGKTTFAQGVALGLGVSMPVTSPSFSLVHLYQGKEWSFVHCDFYRLRSTEEAVNIGFLDYLTKDNVVLVEWGAAFYSLMPAGAMSVTIEYVPEGRLVRLDERVSQCLC